MSRLNNRRGVRSGWRWTRRGVGACVGVAVLSACQPRALQQGAGRDIVATYTMGELQAVLPGELSVPQLQAAAESTLRARGYVIRDSATTEERMRVVGESRVDGRHNETTIRGRVTYSNVAVLIESGAFGDEAASRAILDDLLRRLGR